MSEDLPEDRSERHRFFFSAGAPSVAITGLDLKQALLKELPGSSEAEETQIKWSVAGARIPDDGAPPFIVMGDLQARHGDYFIGCQVGGHVDFRDRSEAPDADDVEVCRGIAAWASSALYDFAASHARTLAGAAVSCTIEIPRLTPIADLDALTITVGTSED